MRKHHINLATFVGYVLAALSAPAIAAQQPRGAGGMVPVRVVVPEPDTAAAEPDIRVTRRAEDGGYAIILPCDAATPENLFAGALVVAGLLERHGDARRDDAVFRVPTATAAPKRYAAVGARVLARLKASAPTTMSGVGLARSTYIYMPDHARRSAAIAAGRRRSLLSADRPRGNHATRS